MPLLIYKGQSKSRHNQFLRSLPLAMAAHAIPAATYIITSAAADNVASLAGGVGSNIICLPLNDPVTNNQKVCTISCLPPLRGLMQRHSLRFCSGLLLTRRV
jgi:hypothetical protein